MLDLKAYLKNPNSENAAQACAQTMVLDSINSLMNGEQHQNQNQTADDPSDLSCSKQRPNESIDSGFGL
jgi:hypothetical protein